MHMFSFYFQQKLVNVINSVHPTTTFTRYSKSKMLNVNTYRHHVSEVVLITLRKNVKGKNEKLHLSPLPSLAHDARIKE